MSIIRIIKFGNETPLQAVENYLGDNILFEQFTDYLKYLALNPDKMSMDEMNEHFFKWWFKK